MVGRAKRKVAELFLLRVFRLDFLEGSSNRIEPEVFFLGLPEKYRTVSSIIG
jgi:hypothetical protein